MNRTARIVVTSVAAASVAGGAALVLGSVPQPNQVTTSPAAVEQPATPTDSERRALQREEADLKRELAAIEKEIRKLGQARGQAARTDTAPPSAAPPSEPTTASPSPTEDDPEHPEDDPEGELDD
jgi:hypothetical protein